MTDEIYWLKFFKLMIIGIVCCVGLIFLNYQLSWQKYNDHLEICVKSGKSWKPAQIQPYQDHPETYEMSCMP